MVTIKAKVSFPVWVELEVSDQTMAAIQDGDEEAIQHTRGELLQVADSYLQSSSVEPCIECDEEELSD